MNKYAFLAVPVAVGIFAAYIMAGAIQEPDGVLLGASRLTEGGSPVMGSLSAPITVLEWGDYQCTFCFRFHESSLDVLKKEYIDSGRINLVFKDFPLNGPDSVLAAEASYCARDQGRYWEYHDVVYSNWAGERTGWITRESLEEFAVLAGVNSDELGRCLDEKKHRQKVEDLRRFGEEIGVDATPSFFVFDDEKIIKIRGNQPIETFRQAISELEKQGES